MNYIVLKEEMEKKQAPKKTIVCTGVNIEGNVVFGEGCIVQPFCSIEAKAGPIFFGNYNIIEVIRY